MPLSTEDDNGPHEGLVSEHFAYRVDGARFANEQSTVWRDIQSPVSHFRFVTGWGCVDILSHGEPRFAVVSCKPRESA